MVTYSVVESIGLSPGGLGGIALRHMPFAKCQPRCRLMERPGGEVETRPARDERVALSPSAQASVLREQEFVGGDDAGTDLVRKVGADDFGFTPERRQRNAQE